LSAGDNPGGGLEEDAAEEDAAEEDAAEVLVAVILAGIGEDKRCSLAENFGKVTTQTPRRSTCESPYR
jgi:hypothetical protein